MNKSENKKSVLLIDPWGTANTSEYLNGLIYGLSSIVDLTVFTNYYFELKVSTNADIHRVFFRKSEKMSQSIMRKILRGAEYIKGYQDIINFLKENDYVDIVHINWLLNYKLDIKFLNELKKYTRKLVYTAHNVLPHINSSSYVRELKEIYGMCDRIVLHGETIKKEFAHYFPENLDKVYIQKHGCNLQSNVFYDDELIPDWIKEKINRYSKRCIYFGRIFQNKGVDRLVKAWCREWEDSLLIIAGQIDGDYPELNKCLDRIEKSENILALLQYVDDNTLNYLISSSQIILLPYRHASMSGVVFTAADFKKTILCTDTGALSEYLVNGEDSFIVENTDESISDNVSYLQENVTTEMLNAMGEQLRRNITKNCSWKIVAEKLVNECYKK